MRELREELGVEVHAAEPLIAYEHAVSRIGASCSICGS